MSNTDGRGDSSAPITISRRDFIKSATTLVGVAAVGPAGDVAPEGAFYLTGHAHIDLSWLWPRSETIHEVCPLTFRSVLALMDKYPDFVFAQSAAQVYKWTERYYPDIFAQIKKKVATGQWEIVGGSWDEHNTNIPCGESLVRQYLYSKRYFKDKFGVDVKVAWLPDVFGFSWNMPQIFRKSGIDYFLTSKLKWQVERNNPPVPFPYHLFWWQAPDGSRVLAVHTLGGYNDKVIPENLLADLKKLKETHGMEKALIVFGRGDHGGGPLPEMLERAVALMKDKSFPTVRFSKAVDYFDMIKAMPESSKLPVMNDELYLKTHRGTLTTDSQVKRDNRQCEILLQNAEKFSLLAHQLGRPYPEEALRALWQKVLFGQVHDNIDGSSVHEVYLDAATDYAEIAIAGQELLSSALAAIAQSLDTRGEGKAIIVFNPLPWVRSDPVFLRGVQTGANRYFKIIDAGGKLVPSQVVGAGDESQIVFRAQDLPGLAWKQYRLVASDEEPRFSADIRAEGLRLRNSVVDLEIDDETGNIIYLKTRGIEKNLFPDNAQGNTLEIWEDRPPQAPKGEPAWNIYLGDRNDLGKPEWVKVVESGPVRAVVRVKRRFANSWIEQDTILYAHSDRVDFALRCDWHEQYRFAKIAFPLALQSYYATYEVPFGSIQRYDHTLTNDPQEKLAHPARAWEPADRTKFEVAAQRWVDVTDRSGSYGISLLNDSKYGFSFQGNTLRMSIVRGPRRGYPQTPETWSDQSDDPIVGIHRVGYSVVPHQSDWCAANTARRAVEFNAPLLVRIEPAHPGKTVVPLATMVVEPENVIVEAMKKAEDSDEFIVRLYETSGKASEAVLSFGRKPISVRETDMLEWDRYVQPKHFRVVGNKARISVSPFEIKTLRVKFA